MGPATVDASTIASVRRFARTVTQGVGVLRDDYLARNRPLGESRVLWEIGPDGCDVRELRARLDLDSGYASRLLRSLEQAGLITVGGGDHDRRVRTARLTAAGRRERAELDRRSDELTSNLVAPLSAAQRASLVSAMGEVERLLTAAAVRIEIVDPNSEAASTSLDAYYAELDERFEEGFDVAQSRLADHRELSLPAGAFLVATLHGAAIGCGAVKFHGRRPAEIKRLWVSRDARGLGLGKRLLAELERTAWEQGARRARLDTNRSLTEAIALYRATGWTEIERFNDERYAHHFFEKRLTAPAEPAR